MPDLYLEDFSTGQSFRSGELRVEAEDIKRFAAEFDPQPFHLDDEAARHTMFGGLAASGWHTAAITMKLSVTSDFKPAGGIIGVGFEELRWPRPVYPGDTLHVEGEVLDVRPSKSNPSRGLIKLRLSTVNQRGEVVQLSVGHLVVPTRGAAAASSGA